MGGAGWGVADSPAVQEVFDLFGEMTAMLEAEGVDAVLEANRAHPAYAHWDTTTLNRVEVLSREYSWWHMSHNDPQISIDPPAIEGFDDIDVPTLIVTAEYDLEACKEAADLLEQSINGATKVVMQGAGRIMNMDKPEEFNQLVLDFMSVVEGS